MEFIRNNVIQNERNIEYISDYATYSFYGLHENMFIGYFGDLKISSDIINYNEYSQYIYTAFLLKFKIGSEHRFDNE